LVFTASKFASEFVNEFPKKIDFLISQVPLGCVMSLTRARSRGAAHEHESVERTLRGKGGIVPNVYDRRSFLTHSAAAAGGIAMAGTIVDSLVSAASADVVTNAGSIPTSGQKGGEMTVGIPAEQPSRTTFTGAGGKMDASAFCIANAIYDSLFVSSSDGLSWLPNLATAATPNATFTEWTIALRSGVKFHDGSDFNADDVVGNYNAQKANATVGLAIAPLINSVTKIDATHVKYTLPFAWTTFPFQLAEQQISFMAHASSLDGGKPIGTGPFKLNILNDWDWSAAGNGDVITLHANTNYWKNDHTGGSLPYLDILKFKVIVDPTARADALRAGTIDVMQNADGSTIKAIRTSPGNLQYRTDENDAREPAVNCIIMNTQQSGYSSSPKTGATNTAAKGCVNGLTKDSWDPNGTAVIADINIRKACAAAINRTTYFSTIDGSVGQILDGLYRPKVNGAANPLYVDPKYPKYDTKAAKKLVDAWKAKNKGKDCKFYIDTVQGSGAQDDAFAFIQNALSTIGITVIQRKLTQPDLIAMKISKQYDASTWSQFGGVTPDLNYVWFNSAKSQFGTKWVSNYVNFAQQADPLVNKAMQTAMGAKTVKDRKAGWQKVNTLLVANMPYLFLDTTVTMFAARSGVRNFTFAESASTSGANAVNGANNTTGLLPTTAGGSASVSSKVFTPDGGSAKWEYLYWN